MLKIKLIKDLPINEKYGCHRGNEYRAKYCYLTPEGTGEPVKDQPVEFTCKTGDRVVAFSYEYQVIEDNESRKEDSYCP